MNFSGLALPGRPDGGFTGHLFSRRKPDVPIDLPVFGQKVHEHGVQRRFRGFSSALLLITLKLGRCCFNVHVVLLWLSVFTAAMTCSICTMFSYFTTLNGFQRPNFLGLLCSRSAAPGVCSNSRVATCQVRSLHVTDSVSDVTWEDLGRPGSSGELPVMSYSAVEPAEVGFPLKEARLGWTEQDRMGNTPDSARGEAQRLIEFIDEHFFPLGFLPKVHVVTFLKNQCAHPQLQSDWPPYWSNRSDECIDNKHMGSADLRSPHSHFPDVPSAAVLEERVDPWKKRMSDNQFSKFIYPEMFFQIRI